MFSLGALVPLLPFLLGFGSLVAGLVLGGIGLFVAGAVASLATVVPWWLSALRQLAFSRLAAGAIVRRRRRPWVVSSADPPPAAATRPCAGRVPPDDSGAVGRPTSRARSPVLSAWRGVRQRAATAAEAERGTSATRRADGEAGPQQRA